MDASAVIQRLRDAGYRLTPQRQAVIEALAASRQHPTAAELYESLRARYPMMGLATVYKTLDLLIDMGEVVETGFGPGGVRFEPNLRPHVNLVCRKCGQVIDVDMAATAGQEQPLAWVAGRAADVGFAIEGGHIEYFGVCAACAGVVER